MKTRTVFETSDSFKADQVEALLSTSGIVFERKSFGAGPYASIVFGGSSSAGIQILVAEDCADKAIEVLEGAGLIPVTE